MRTDKRCCSSIAHLLRGRELGFQNVLTRNNIWCPIRSHLRRRMFLDVSYGCGPTRNIRPYICTCCYTIVADPQKVRTDTSDHLLPSRYCKMDSTGNSMNYYVPRNEAPPSARNSILISISLNLAIYLVYWEEDLL